jgi:hypothetical protein
VNVATLEVIVKGRTDDEIFFSMPREWEPSAAMKERIKRAPNQPLYDTYKTHRRWRASIR